MRSGVVARAKAELSHAGRRKSSALCTKQRVPAGECALCQEAKERREKGGRNSDVVGFRDIQEKARSWRGCEQDAVNGRVGQHQSGQTEVARTCRW